MFYQIDGTPNQGHLDEFVKKRLASRILPHLEAEQDKMLMACVPPFREL